MICAAARPHRPPGRPVRREARAAVPRPAAARNALRGLLDGRRCRRRRRGCRTGGSAARDHHRGIGVPGGGEPRAVGTGRLRRCPLGTVTVRLVVGGCAGRGAGGLALPGGGAPRGGAPRRGAPRAVAPGSVCCAGPRDRDRRVVARVAARGNRGTGTRSGRGPGGGSGSGSGSGSGGGGSGSRDVGSRAAGRRGTGSRGTGGRPATVGLSSPGPVLIGPGMGPRARSRRCGRLGRPDPRPARLHRSGPGGRLRRAAPARGRTPGRGARARGASRLVPEAVRCASGLVGVRAWPCSPAAPSATTDPAQPDRPHPVRPARLHRLRCGGDPAPFATVAASATLSVPVTDAASPAVNPAGRCSRSLRLQTRRHLAGRGLPLGHESPFSPQTSRTGPHGPGSSQVSPVPCSIRSAAMACSSRSRRTRYVSPCTSTSYCSSSLARSPTLTIRTLLPTPNTSPQTRRLRGHQRSCRDDDSGTASALHHRCRP